jgi:hypothetical protein
MEKKEYLALVLREANLFVDRNEARLRECLARSGSVAGMRNELEEQLKDVLFEVDHLEDVLKHAELDEPDPAVWRDAGSFQGALAGAAMAALAHDVGARVVETLEGRLPRMRNVQVR